MLQILLYLWAVYVFPLFIHFLYCYSLQQSTLSKQEIIHGDNTKLESQHLWKRNYKFSLCGHSVSRLSWGLVKLAYKVMGWGSIIMFPLHSLCIEWPFQSGKPDWSAAWWGTACWQSPSCAFFLCLTSEQKLRSDNLLMLGFLLHPLSLYPKIPYLTPLSFTPISSAFLHLPFYTLSICLLLVVLSLLPSWQGRKVEGQVF